MTKDKVADLPSVVSFPIGSPTERLKFALDLAWHLLLQRIVSGRNKINKESSLQLHYASVIHELGELLCILPGETFSIELETAVGKKNIDIVCRLADVSAAIELKCFRKQSNRAVDLDMYAVLSDLERLCNFKEFAIRRFICLTDNSFYYDAKHSGHAASVSIREGTIYKAGTCIIPSWVGKWKKSKQDNPITLATEVAFNWQRSKGWHWLSIDLPQS